MSNSKSTVKIRGMDEEAENLLLKIEEVAKSSCDATKKVIPSILLTCDRGLGAEEFATEFERILSANHVYKVRGAGTYLSLVFPRNADEKLTQRFFQSPKVVAEFQNNFYGVFSISFEEWEGSDLLMHDNFNALLTYIDNNKDNIFFVFRVTEGFKAKEELSATLKNHINIVEVSISRPTIEMAAEYIQSCLENDGLTFSMNGKKALKSFLKRKLDMDVDEFAGYSSLKQIANSIQFELVAEHELEDRRLQVSDHMIKNIESRVVIPENITPNQGHRIGFSM